MSSINYVKLGDTVVLPGTHLNILNFLNISLPHPEGLVGLYLLGGSAGTSIRNFADSSKPLTVVGSPTISSIGAAVNNLNYFDTGLVTGADRTWTIIAKPKLAATSADRACLVTNRRFTGGFYRGDAMQWEETNLLQNRFDKTAAASGQSPSTALAGADTTAWNGVAGIVGADGVATTGWRRNGSTSWTAPSTATTRTVYSGTNLQIGGGLAGEVATCNIALVALQNVVLTQTQVNENMTYLSSLLAMNYGIAPF